MSGPTYPFGNPTGRPSWRGSASGHANNANRSPFMFGGTSTGVSEGGSVFSFGPLPGASSASAFGGFAYGARAAAPIFGSEGAFGASGNPAFGGFCSPPFGFISSTASKPAETTFSSNQFGAHIGSQVATPLLGSADFGKSSFRGRWLSGSRVAPFTPATEADTGVALPSGELQSICCTTLHPYREKSHEELRWEDYQLGDKGGPNHAGQSGVGQATALCGQSATPAFGQMRTFNTASSGYGGSLFPNTASPFFSTNAAATRQTNPSFPSPFQTAGVAETSGKLTGSAFGSQSIFGLRNTANDNPFVANSSGCSLFGGNPFSSPTGGSVSFGGTSTGVFRSGLTQTPPLFSSEATQTPSLFSSKAAFRAADGIPKDGPLEEQTDFVEVCQKIKGVHLDSSLQNDEEHVINKGTGESAVEHDCDAGIEALMPKLSQPDYYTKPDVKELAAKERAEPGFCCRVKDFVIGRLGYGHIKFAGETDVRRLDLESLIRFNNSEVIVYTDERKKPPIGQGLNKPAEVTLLNVKCIDKKTGKQYIEGPTVEKYKEMLKKGAEEQGAEFVSYDPIKGEWKFKVRHFN